MSNNHRPVTHKEIRRKIALRNSLLKEQKGRCYYCKRVLGPADATLDHIRPLAVGGSDDRVNLCASCERCNTLKGNMHLSDFFEKFKIFPSKPPRKIKRTNLRVSNLDGGQRTRKAIDRRDKQRATRKQARKEARIPRRLREEDEDLST